VVCILPEALPNASRTVSYPTYIHEILRHAGLCYSTVSAPELAQALPQMALLLTVGEYQLPEALLAALRNWVAGGGHWVAVGIQRDQTLFCDRRNTAATRYGAAYRNSTQAS